MPPLKLRAARTPSVCPRVTRKQVVCVENTEPIHMSAAEPDSSATVATVATARPPRRLAKVLRRFAVPLACTASAAGAALALSVLGWVGALGAAVASGVGGWALVRIGRRSHPRAAQELSEARLGAQIVPVWQRTVEAAKTHSARNADTLLESFANVSGHLDQALAGGTSLTLDNASIEQLLDRHKPELERLLQATLNEVRQKEQMLAVVNQLREEIGGMLNLARDVQSISRATHLLAMNASVEATRAGAAGSGMAVVAQEVRGLAGQSRQAGNQLAKFLSDAQDRLASANRTARRHATDDDEIRMQADDAARDVLRALLGSVAEAARSSQTLRLAGRQVQTDLEKIFMGLQGQDRLSQMLSSVTEDMDRYSAWLRGRPDPVALRPSDWLTRLEQSYTMEDMRSAHHGNVAIEQSQGVEFF